MEVFGITGTNGKTTTAYMLDEILRHGGIGCALVGTVMHRIGNSVYEAVNTTPGKDLFRRYKEEAEAQGIETFITEASSHALDQGRLDEMPIKYAAFTNLTRDHMDYHESMEAYYIAKRKLFDFKTLTSAIINIDDRYGKRLYGEVRGERTDVRTFSVSLEDDKADFFGRIEKEGFCGTTFVIKSSSGEKEFFISQPGRYNVYNAITAVALAVQRCDIMDIEKAAQSLKNFKGAPGRFEIIRGRSKEIVAICDYAHTPDALLNLLRTVKDIKDKDIQTKGGRIITVFGCGGDRDRGKRPEMGRTAGIWSDYSIITSDNPRNEDALDIIAQIEEGICETTSAYTTEPARDDAIKKAVMMARPGDVIVVAGKGHETYQMIGTEKQHFDDREKIRELL